MSPRIPAFLLAFVLAGPAVAAADDTLDEQIESVLKTPGFQNGRWGLLIVDGANGKVLYEKAADQLFRPASVTKLFSTAAALVELGPDHRFRTPVVRRGEVDAAGVLKGDLILVARGDLALGGRTGPAGELLFVDGDHTYAGAGLDGDIVATDPLAGLDHLAREVREAGITAITGDVLIDDRFFAPASSSGSGPRRVSPIVVNDNIVDFLVAPGSKAGEPATVKIVPSRSFLDLDVQIETVAEGGTPRIDATTVGTRGVALRGQIPVGHRPILRSVPVEEPDDFARALFIEALRARGVKVSVSPLAANHPGKLPSVGEVAKLAKVAEYVSPPLEQYAKVILKVSHNLHASTLPMLLAAKHGETTLADGLKRQGTLLKGLGVDLRAISFGGGAGGSSADLVTPRATVQLLQAMAKRPTEFPAYESALPVLGRDGTLAKHAAPNSAARGHVRAKTGTYWVVNDLTGKAVLTSKALAGYMETASGRPLVFAFFLNDVSLDATAENVGDATLEAGRLLGKLCEVVYKADLTPAAP